MPHVKQEPRREEKVPCLSKGQRILTSRYCFYCNATGREKWHWITNGGRKGGAGTDCLAGVATCWLECHLHWIISGCALLIPPQMNRLNHFWCIQTVHAETHCGRTKCEHKRWQLFFFHISLSIFSTLVWKDKIFCRKVFNFAWAIVPQPYMCSAVQSCYQKARCIVSQCFVCNSPRNTLRRSKAACCGLIKGASS